MKSVTLQLTSENGDTSKPTATFDDAGLTKLDTYLRYMARVRETRLIRRGLPQLPRMRLDANGFVMESAPVEDSELHELLHVLRPVTLAKEPASFSAVSDLLEKAFGDLCVTQHMNATRDLFEHGELRPYLQVHVGDQPLFDSSVLRLWLNGTQYHTDSAKAEAWSALESALSAPNARALVMGQLRGRIVALVELERVVSLCLS